MHNNIKYNRYGFTDELAIKANKISMKVRAKILAYHLVSIFTCISLQMKYNNKIDTNEKEVIVAIAAPRIPNTGISDIFNIIFTSAPKPVILRLKSTRSMPAKTPPMDL